MMAENPWLRIPAHEYEAHMADIGQAIALRNIFEKIYARTKPRRLLVLGCTTGKDFELLDREVTSQAVGVDVNGEYLAIARQNLAALGRSVELVQADVL
jgi:ubiquinone/menaquinone biosynthesis C-methylase UbiE